MSDLFLTFPVLGVNFLGDGVKTVESARFTDVADLILNSVRETRIEVMVQSAIAVSPNLGHDSIEVNHIAIHAMGVLRRLWATIIPSLSVPLSLVGTLAVMYQLGFSLDNLSLMALTIATGFVVDDAIVVIENIARFLEAGDSPYDAAMKGSAQIGFTIISLTVSLLAVLIPLLFMGDVVGRLFHEFAITLAATIIISAIVSLTLVPMLCAKLLRPRGHGGAASGGRFFQALTRFYASTRGMPCSR